MDRTKPEPIARVTPPSIAIIGGGATGLALAYRLVQAGRRVTIIEKGPQLSGLLTFTTVDGVPIERFYHHFFTTDRYLLDLLDELGLRDRIRWRASASAVVHDGTISPFVTKLDSLRLPFLGWRTKVRAGLATLRMRGQRPEDLPPDLTAETYLRRLYGAEGWERLWRPLLVNKFGEEDSHRLTATWVAKRIQVRTSSERGGREVLGYFDGSYRVLFDALHHAIVAGGGRILLNTAVTSLTPTGGGYRIGDEQYDAVVSTIAPALISAIAPDLKLPPVTYRSALVPLFTLRVPVTPYYWLNILDRRFPGSVIVNQQALLPDGYYHGRWPLYVGHYLPLDSDLLSRSDAALADHYLAALEPIFPGIRRQVVGYEISRAKYAQPVVTAPWQPLSHTTNLPNLYVTSMAHIFPEDRGVNYAIREAERIAALLTAPTS